MLQTVQNSVFLTPSGLFRQDSDRLGHGKDFFRAQEGVSKYTKQAKSALGGFNDAMYMPTSPPHQIQTAPFRKPGGPQNGPKRSFFGPKFCLLSEFEDFLKNLKYFSNCEAIFENK